VIGLPHSGQSSTDCISAIIRVVSYLFAGVLPLFCLFRVVPDIEGNSMKLAIRFCRRVYSIAAYVSFPLIALSLPQASAQGRELEQVETQPSQPGPAQSRKYELLALRGKVVELGPYLAGRHQVAIDEDAGKEVLVLVTDSGDAHPIVKDVRSRGFWMDERLRDRSMELHVHKFPGVPFVRLMDVYSFKHGKKHRVDYWCTICAITTYQPGPCPCCQDEIELRERPVEEIKPGQ
jgi:hypothetical protein